MKRLRLEDLSAGLVLAEPVRSDTGQLLLPVGRSLDGTCLRLLDVWGVGSVAVEDGADGAAGPPQLDPERLAMAEASLAPRFRHTESTHPLVAELFAYCARRAAAKPVTTTADVGA